MFKVQETHISGRQAIKLKRENFEGKLIDVESSSPFHDENVQHSTAFSMFIIELENESTFKRRFDKKAYWLRYLFERIVFSSNFYPTFRVVTNIIKFVLNGFLKFLISLKMLEKIVRPIYLKTLNKFISKIDPNFRILLSQKNSKNED